MRLTTEQVAEIRAAEGVYRAGDVARAYEVATSTVTRIWDYQSHLDVRPADEPPNIPTRKYVKDYAEDIQMLRGEGYTVNQIAQRIGLSRSALYAYMGVYI